MEGDSKIIPTSPLGQINKLISTAVTSQFLPLIQPSSKSKNIDRIKFLRKLAGLNDAEALALIFEDKDIIDDGTLRGRLLAILDATEHYLIPGLQTGIDFMDEGFRGDRNYGGSGFKDPHPSSRNQVGHFLTALGLAFRPEVISRYILGKRMRDWIGIPDSYSDFDAALRLIIGHELAPDPDVLTAAIIGTVEGIGLIPATPGPIGANVIYEIWSSFRNQFFSVKQEDVDAFNAALNALGNDLILNLAAAEISLGTIFSKINVNQRGNSYQDLRLSLVGWYLGNAILQSKYVNGAQVADWIRKNLKE